MDVVGNANSIIPAGSRLFVTEKRKQGEIKMYPWIDEYLLHKAGCSKDFKAEWGWERYFVGGKMFACIAVNEAKEAVFVSMRCETDFNEFLRSNYQSVTPGYYMNKEHWNTLWFRFDQIPDKDKNPKAPQEYPSDELLKEMLNRSYQLIFSKLTKKQQKEISEYPNKATK